MIRGFHLADFLTLGNAACGVLAVFAVMGYVEARTPRHLLTAAALIPLALVFDVLDGRVARSRQKHSAMGRELDSLADVISFGVAPAAIAYAAGMSGLWDVVILVYFVCCGVSRLARFNVTAEALSVERRQGHVLRGHADPLEPGAGRGGRRWRPGSATSATRCRSASVRLGPGRASPLTLAWALSGSLMISKTLRIPKL